MTAIIRHPVASMSSIASHPYADPSQYPHLRPPLTQIPNHSSATKYYPTGEEFPDARFGNEKNSTEGIRNMAYGAAYQQPHMDNAGVPQAPSRALQHPGLVQQVAQQNIQGTAAQTHYVNRTTRTRSPIEEVSPKHVEFKKEPDMYQADNTEQIAPYLQIPLEINSSKGSLSDFAAQITCLFWFESSQTLLRVEESRSTPLPLQPLIPEANPTIGFRKWVTTILSTTQVSTNVVLLALMFVYRLKKMNPSVKGKPGSEYRLLTVALMLGNKFLDDNTYTNKTWGEVSGITVNEIHVMEVEFLSNMRYTLYASKQEWQLWLQKLARFAEYFEAASKAAEEMQNAAIQAQQQTLPTTPIQSMNPTTPTRLYATPAKPTGTPTSRPTHPLAMPLYPNQITAVPIPRMPEVVQTSRKRSYDDSSDERPSKRLSRNLGINVRPDTMSPASSLGSGGSMFNDQSTGRTTPGYNELPNPRPNVYPDPTHRLPLPLMANQQMLPQLPFNYPQVPQMNQMPQMQIPRAMTSVYPPTTQAGLEVYKPQPQMQAPLGLRMPPLMDPGQTISATTSRNNSPMASVITPTGELLSPMVYGNYRSSPYKPVRTVNSLLAPPPSTSLGNPANGIGSSDLQYRPLGKQPGQSRVGVVPHIPQAYPHHPWPIQNPQSY